MRAKRQTPPTFDLMPDVLKLLKANTRMQLAEIRDCVLPITTRLGFRLGVQTVNRTLSRMVM
jgi:hypothetical protein